MGSTITTARVAAAVRTQQGRTLFALFEETYCSNVSPKIPSWCCVSLGYLAATMERIFDLASSCEGGMLRNRSGRLSPEGYIGTWLKELANPLILQSTGIRFDVGNGFQSTVASQRLNEAVDLLAKAERPAKANELHDTSTVTLDLVDDAEAVLALQAGLKIDPWQLIHAHAVSHRSGERNRVLGHHPAQGRTPAPDVPIALTLGPDVRLLQDSDGNWRCGGWQYALVGKHVRGLWQAELACPGHYRKQIAVFRAALDSALPAPANLVVEIDGAGTNDAYQLRKIGDLRQQAGSNSVCFDVPVTPENEYNLTNLPHDCARWLLPNPTIAGRVNFLKTAMTTPDVLTTLAKLPPRCFATIPGSRGPRTIEIVRGIPGYSEIDAVESSFGLKGIHSAEILNAELDVLPSPEQIEAMVAGSMFGWHVPGADPDIVRARNAAQQAEP